jgi:uncharacterized membrane protein
MTDAALSGSLPRTKPRLGPAAIILGVALSAFFDGILLHQVLQWHHLLSLARGATWRDIHNQVLADGLFHIAVYLLMLAGLAMLWRSRAGLDRPGAGLRFIADVILGFGLWNVIDVVGFHWIAGIHRVRVDVPNPLPWDLGWLAVLGAVPLLVGLWLRRRPGGGGHGRGMSAAVSVAVLVAGAATLIPTTSRTGSIVIFRPDISPYQAFATVAAAGGAVADVSPSGRSMIVALPDAGARWSLYAGGALLVGGGALAGCGTRI